MTIATPALERRVDPVTGARHAFTLTWRNLVSVKHNPFELLDLSIQPIMFVLLFVYVFGGAIAGSIDAYVQLIIPGIMAMNIAFGSVSVGIGLNTDVTKGVFDRFRSLPIARSAPLVGRVIADALKQVWGIALMLAVGYIIGFRLQTDLIPVLGAVALMVAFFLCLSWFAVFIGMMAKTPENVQIWAFTLMMPLTFISNVFVPTETMPGWLQAYVDISPVSLLAEANRGLMLGGPVAAPATGALIWGIVLALIFAPLALWALRRRV